MNGFERQTMYQGVAAPSERPVFLLGCAWRCGSTLMQRVLSSHPELHVWGENHGVISALAQASDCLERQHLQLDTSAAVFADKGLAGFIPNLNPPAEVARAAPRAWLLAYYHDATLALGKARWGFKDVRYDAAMARFLLATFPDGRVVFLVRNPISVLASMNGASWYRAAGGARGVMARWSQNTRTFAQWQDSRVLTVRYETLAADPGGEMQRVSQHLGLDAAGFDLRLFDKVVRGGTWTPRVGLAEAATLLRPAARRACQAAGYPDPMDDARLRPASLLASTPRSWLDSALRAMRR